jgi:hypothetical protein
MNCFCNRKESLLEGPPESGFGASKNKNLDSERKWIEINVSIKITAVTISFGRTSF